MNNRLIDFKGSSVEKPLRKYFALYGLREEDIDRAVEDYSRYRDRQVKSLSLLSSVDLSNVDITAITKDLIKDTEEVIDEIARGYFRYLDYRKEIVEKYQEAKNWGEVFSTVVYSDMDDSQEAFIDYIEETYQTKVKDAKHLSELTGITHLYKYWDKDKGFISEEEAEKLAKKTKKPLKSYRATEKQTREEALRELEETLTTSRSNKYYRALAVSIEEGAKYKDLLEIDPKDFGLTEPWNDWLRKDKQTSIFWAIGEAFLLYEPGGLMLLPSLRAVAQEIEAPYSVVMDSYKQMRLK